VIVKSQVLVVVLVIVCVFTVASVDINVTILMVTLIGHSAGMKSAAAGSV